MMNIVVIVVVSTGLVSLTQILRYMLEITMQYTYKLHPFWQSLVPYMVSRVACHQEAEGKFSHSSILLAGDVETNPGLAYLVTPVESAKGHVHLIEEQRPAYFVSHVMSGSIQSVSGYLTLSSVLSVVAIFHGSVVTVDSLIYRLDFLTQTYLMVH